MKTNMKKLILSTAIAGVAVLSVPAGAASDVYPGGTTDATENRAVPQDRNITNPNHDATTQSTSVSNADIDHEGVVHFEPNSVSLTQQAEGQLKQLVEQLDKDKPVSLTLEMRDSGADVNSSSSLSTQRAPGNMDSSAGYPADAEGLAGRTNSADSATDPAAQPSTNAEALEAEQRERAQLITQYRAENIRVYLQEKGIEVVEVSVEGEAAISNGIQSTEQSSLSTTQGQTAEDVQQVRIVVIGEVRPEGLSAL
jgi:outer membrane protein OmpA-like peptidoglycan-associated protein